MVKILEILPNAGYQCLSCSVNYILTKVSVVPYEQFINKENKKLGVQPPLRTGIVKAKLRVRKFSDKFP